MTDRERFDPHNLALSSAPEALDALFQRLASVVYDATPSYANSDLWVLTYVNQAVERLTGYPLASFLGQDATVFLYNLIHPEDRPRVGAEYDRCRTTLSPIGLRYRIGHRDGSYQWVEERTRFKRDGDGQLHATAIVQIIDEASVQAEANARVDRLLATLNSDVAVATGQEFLEHLTRRLAFISGVRQAGIFRVDRERYVECLALARDGLMLPRFSARIEQTLFQPLTQQSKVTLDLSDRLASGVEYMVALRHVHAFRLDNRHNQWVGVLVLDHEDAFEPDDAVARVLELYSDRAVTEIQRLSLESRLQYSEQRYRAFFETAVLPSLVVTLTGRIVELNGAAKDLLGVSDQTVRDDWTVSDILPPKQSDGRYSMALLLRLIRQSLKSEPEPEQVVVHTFDGRVRTVIVHATSTALSLSERVLLTLEDITERLATEHHLEVQHQLMEERQARLRGLARLATELERQADVREFLFACRDELFQLDGVEQLAFYRIETQCWRHTAKSGESPAWRQEFHQPTLDRVRVLGTMQLVRRQDPWLYFPLLENGETVAILVIECGTNLFRDQEFISLLSQTLSLAFDNLVQRLTLKRQARRDSLTGLGNRAQLHEWVAQALQDDPQQEAALLLFDLNKFKEINDTLGHHFGDRLLCEISPRLQSVLKQEDDRGIARLGGDEFAVFLPGMGLDASWQLSERIAQALSEPYLLDEIQLQVEASIGLAHYPEQGQDGHELLRCADVAMYAAKSSGRSVVAFETMLDATTPHRIAVLSELDQALSDGQIWVAYQPVVRASDGHIVGLEALVRWTHPELGALSPAEFIPIAEMGQGIRRITHFVLERSLSALQRWRQQLPELHVAVNLSGRVLMDQSLPQQIQALLERCQLPGEALILELTESTLLSDPLRAVDIINEMANLGVQVEVDDFGTGYSSLAYLKSLPIHALKIDQSFVADLLLDPQDRVIVESTITMAHALGLQTVAEGVEDEATLIELVKMQCDAIQGYYFSKPIPESEVAAWLARYER
ncbi:MAG: bifunctional diguanylate cyclase/phosphodiesterase [Saccharospirillum sp.]